MAENVTEGQFTEVEDETNNHRPKTRSLTLPDTDIIKLPAAPQSQNQKAPLFALLGALQGENHERRTVDMEHKAIRKTYRTQLREVVRVRMAKDTADGIATLQWLGKNYPRGSKAANFLNEVLEYSAKTAPEQFTNDMEGFIADTNKSV